jgi:hypothetical protein
MNQDLLVLFKQIYWFKPILKMAQSLEDLEKHVLGLNTRHEAWRRQCTSSQMPGMQPGALGRRKHT